MHSYKDYIINVSRVQSLKDDIKKFYEEDHFNHLSWIVFLKS